MRWKSKKLGVIAVDETVLMKSYRFEIKHHRDTNWSLKISDIELDDDDTYRCRARNNTFAEAKLTVEGLQTDILLFGLHRDKTGLRGLQQSKFQTSLLSYIDLLEN